MGKFILSFKRKGTIPPVTPDQPETPSGSDLVSLGILTKPIAEFSNSDVGTTVLIPYNDPTGKILLNNGNIEFEVVGVNHHTNSEHSQTITLMTKNIIRNAAFDAKEPNNPDSNRRDFGNNRWSVSNIRQWLNSPAAAAGSWFNAEKTHAYDAAPTTDKVYGNEAGAYAADPGFLAGFSAGVLQHFTDVTNTTFMPYIDTDGYEITETTIDKVFLPSFTEMFGSGSEGSQLAKFNDTDSRKKSGQSTSYWTRSRSSSDFRTVTYVDGDGGYNLDDTPYNGSYGIAPIIVLH